MRIVEIILAINALCGIAAFVIARGLIRKMRRKVFGELEAPPKLTKPE
jgi:hypothetical protein